MEDFIIIPRYFVRINGETVSQGQVRKSFHNSQSAAEFAWDDIKRGAYVYTFNDQNDLVTCWKYDHVQNCIIGTNVVESN